jgi:hypothetical protein
MPITETERLRAQVDYLSAQLEELKRPRDAGTAERMRAAQHRADSVLSYRGERAVEPLPNDTELSYRARLATSVGAHTSEFKTSRFDSCDNNLLTALEDRLYPMAEAQIRNDADGRPGVLVPREEYDESGRRITKFYGDPMAWMQHFHSGAQIGNFIRPEGISR